MADKTPIPLTFSRVTQALEALRRDFARLITQADRRIAGPGLSAAVPVWTEGLIEEVLHLKGIDLGALQEAGAVPVQEGAPGRRPPARRDRTFTDREVALEPITPPDWMIERMPEAQAYRMKPGGCGVVVGQDERHGWHLHIAHVSRLPTWGELYDAQRLLIPPTVMLAMMFYPIAWESEPQANRLSLYEVQPRDMADLAQRMREHGL